MPLEAVQHVPFVALLAMRHMQRTDARLSLSQGSCRFQLVFLTSQLQPTKRCLGLSSGYPEPVGKHECTHQ